MADEEVVHALAVLEAAHRIGATQADQVAATQASRESAMLPFSHCRDPYVSDLRCMSGSRSHEPPARCHWSRKVPAH